MQTPRVLVLGCSDDLRNSGLKADKKAIAANKVEFKIVSTGAISRRDGDRAESSLPETTAFQSELHEAFQCNNCNAVKIGAISSVDAVRAVSESLKQCSAMASVVDMEPFFKAGEEPQKELLMALIQDLLPSITVLSATVREVVALLDAANIEAGYPTGVQGIMALGTKLQSIGPKYVIVKREIFDEPEMTTTLHFVLCGGEEAAMERLRCENAQGVFGVSYSIPPSIAAHLAKGLTGPEAVTAGFNFARDMLARGSYFD